MVPGSFTSALFELFFFLALVIVFVSPTVLVHLKFVFLVENLGNEHLCVGELYMMLFLKVVIVAPIICGFDTICIMIYWKNITSIGTKCS